MGQTLVEKILSEKMGRPVHAGETVVVDVDFAALHDGSGPLLVRLTAVPVSGTCASGPWESGRP